MDAPIQKRESFARAIAPWILAAFSVRILFILLTPQVIDSADSILYLDAAQKIADGHFGEVYSRIPLLYPALAAIASFALSEIEWAAVVVSLLAGTLLVAPVYLLSFAMHGLNAARISALTVVLWPWLIDYACRVAPEALYSVLWFTATTLAIATVRRGGWRSCVLPFALLALYLSRPEGIVAAGAVLLAGMIAGSDSKTSALRLLPSLLVLVVAIPMHLWLMQKLSAMTGVAPRISTSTVSFSFIERGGESLRTAVRLLLITLPVMLGPVLGILAIVGVTTKANTRDKKIEFAIALVAAAQFVAAAFSTYAEPRYVMTTVITIALWSGHGAAVLAQWAGASRRWRTFSGAPVVLICAMMVLGLLPNIVPPMLGRMSYKPLEYKIAGRWMSENLEPGLIFSRKPQVGYYAKMPTSGPAPGDTLDDIRARIVDAGMRYVVVDERYSTQLAPALLPLLDPENAPPWLRALKSDLSPYPDARIVIYEVEKDALGP